jgi:hypothetical protein
VENVFQRAARRESELQRPAGPAAGLRFLSLPRESMLTTLAYFIF